MLEILERIRSFDVLNDISSGDTMFDPSARRHYRYVGRSDLLTLLNVVDIRASYPGGDGPIERIFDFGCGHGRVTRWLRVAFPEAAISVTDFDQAGVDWCVAKFKGADTKGEIPEDSFDLVWLGSVFTHLRAEIAEPLLKRLLGSLRANGVLVFSTQGRFAAERMKTFDWENDQRHWMHYNLDRERFDEVVRGYVETGYGYVDYPGQTDYGVCIAKPSWYAERALASNDFIQILMQEKGADNHQDVLAFMRADLLDMGKGPLW